MWNGKKVSLVFPAYNEESGIYRAVTDFQQNSIVDEVLVVNNNSSDNTVSEAQKTSARIVQQTLQGYGNALTLGLKEAMGDFVILAEPDGTFQGKDVIKLLSYSDDFDMVCGTRTTRELIWQGANMGWLLRVGNLFVAKIVQFLFNGPSLSDCGCTLRLIRKEALQKIVDDLTVGGSHFLPEMVILALQKKLSVIEIPVNYHPRVGTSKITGNFKGAIRTGLNMIKLVLYYRFRFWTKPENTQR